MMDKPGLRIKTKRQELRIKQYELAKLVGMSQSSLSELESGESKLPSAEILIKLAASLGVTPAWIVTGQEGEMEVLTPDEQDFLMAAKQLSHDQRGAVFAMIKSLLKT